MTKDRQIDDRMKRILALHRKCQALTNLIAALQRGRAEIRETLRFGRRSALDVTLGTNSAGAAVRTIDTAIARLRRERGNVRRALARFAASSEAASPRRSARTRKSPRSSGLVPSGSDREASRSDR